MRKNGAHHVQHGYVFGLKAARDTNILRIGKALAQKLLRRLIALFDFNGQLCRHCLYLHRG
jgi:hypothetical protein